MTTEAVLDTRRFNPSREERMEKYIKEGLTRDEADLITTPIRSLTKNKEYMVKAFDAKDKHVKLRREEKVVEQSEATMVDVQES